MPEKDIKEKEQMDFEIQFLEGILKKNPEFVEALGFLGELYTLKGAYKEGLAVDERLAKLRPSDETVLYNLACSYSLLNDIDKSLTILRRAVECGYNDFRHLERDHDLDNIRKDSRFEEFLLKLKALKLKSNLS